MTVSPARYRAAGRSGAIVEPVRSGGPIAPTVNGPADATETAAVHPVTVPVPDGVVDRVTTPAAVAWYW